MTQREIVNQDVEVMKFSEVGDKIFQFNYKFLNKIKFSYYKKHWDEPVKFYLVATFKIKSIRQPKHLQEAS